MRRYRDKDGILRRCQKFSAARLDDESKKTRTYYPTYEAAAKAAETRVLKAKAKGEQHQDRFYVWHWGTAYSFGE